MTPLHFAASYVPQDEDEAAYRKMMEYLVNGKKSTEDVDGATTPSEDVDGATTIKMIDVNCTDEQDGATPLHFACRSGNLIAVEVLLSRISAVDLNKVDKRHVTPLHLACTNSNPAIAKALLEKDAEVDMMDIDQRTPLHYAAQHNQDSIIVLLMER